MNQNANANWIHINEDRWDKNIGWLFTEKLKTVVAIGLRYPFVISVI